MRGLVSIKVDRVPRIAIQIVYCPAHACTHTCIWTNTHANGSMCTQSYRHTQIGTKRFIKELGYLFQIYDGTCHLVDGR